MRDQQNSTQRQKWTEDKDIVSIYEINQEDHRKGFQEILKSFEGDFIELI